MSIIYLNEYLHKIKSNLEKERIPGYFAIIPIKILENKKLPATAKIIFGELTALTNKYGYCYAQNNYLKQMLGISKKTIQRNLQLLKKMGLIRVDIEKNKSGTYRKIFILK